MTDPSRAQTHLPGPKYPGTRREKKRRRTRSFIPLIGRNPESSEASLQGHSPWPSPNRQSPDDGLWFEHSGQHFTW